MFQRRTRTEAIFHTLLDANLTRMVGAAGTVYRHSQTPKNLRQKHLTESDYAPLEANQKREKRLRLFFEDSSLRLNK